VTIRETSAPTGSWERAEARFAWAMAAPALAVIGLVALFPIVWTFWESLHLHDLRMPWLGRPFVGAANYVEVFSDPRFRSALAHTVFFVATTVTIELAAGLLLAFALDRISRGRGIVRTAVLLPWAIPSAVGALVWRFIFESPNGVANAIIGQATPFAAPVWFADPMAAWLPLVLADAWKTTPFVALLLLAGLQSIDRSLYEAAGIDGAGPWRQFTALTLPLLRPALFAAFLFRALDAFRVFDLVYAMTGGGPGTATEPIAMYAFSAMLQHLRFGFGAALSTITFISAFVFALVCIRLGGGAAFREREP
jgi:ABC-type sugar transport system permease subunit